MSRLVLLLLLCLVHGQAGELAIYLIGTGGPELSPDRHGLATLIQVDGEYLLFDAGRGALDGIYSARLPPQNVTKIFLTHLHSDHIEGLPSLWITPWFLLGRKTPLEVWGPLGTSAMVEGMRSMYGHDLQNRSNAVFKREYLDIKVNEFSGGTVYSQSGIQAALLFKGTTPRLAVFSHIVKKRTTRHPEPHCRTSMDRRPGDPTRGA